MTLYQHITTFLIAVIIVGAIYFAGMVFIDKLGEYLARWFRGWY